MCFSACRILILFITSWFFYGKKCRKLIFEFFLNFPGESGLPGRQQCQPGKGWIQQVQNPSTLSLNDITPQFLPISHTPLTKSLTLTLFFPNFPLISPRLSPMAMEMSMFFSTKVDFFQNGQLHFSHFIPFSSSVSPYSPTNFPLLLPSISSFSPPPPPTISGKLQE